MPSARSLVTAATLVIAAALALGAPAARAQTEEPAACTASFHVLHDDTIGELSVPAGLYQLTPTGMTCGVASHLFAQFLRDYDGVLPKPWTAEAGEAGGQATFSGRGTSFTAARTAALDAPAQPGPTSAGGGTHGDLVCPGSFEVLHNNRIGKVRIPAGHYRITLLGGDITCASAMRNFKRFLERPRGNLPGGWFLLPESAEFVRNSIYDGFRIKQLPGDH